MSTLVYHNNTMQQRLLLSTGDTSGAEDHPPAAVAATTTTARVPVEPPPSLTPAAAASPPAAALRISRPSHHHHHHHTTILPPIATIDKSRRAKAAPPSSAAAAAAAATMSAGAPTPPPFDVRSQELVSVMTPPPITAVAAATAAAPPLISPPFSAAINSPLGSPAIPLSPPPSSPSSPSSRSRNLRLAPSSVRILQAWLEANANRPYPSAEAKYQLCLLTGLSDTQISNWFGNARRRQSWLKSHYSPPISQKRTASLLSELESLRVMADDYRKQCLELREKLVSTSGCNSPAYAPSFGGSGGGSPEPRSSYSPYASGLSSWNGSPTSGLSPPDQPHGGVPQHMLDIPSLFSSLLGDNSANSGAAAAAGERLDDWPTTHTGRPTEFLVHHHIPDYLRTQHERECEQPATVTTTTTTLAHHFPTTDQPFP